MNQPIRSLRPCVVAMLLCVMAWPAAATEPVLVHDTVIDNPYGIILERSRLQSVGPDRPAPGAVTYQAFNGDLYDLLEHVGVHTRVLVPEQWPEGEPGLTDDQLEELVDQLDLLWERYVALLGREAGGTGPQIVAFLPETCTNIQGIVPAGCGQVGRRGVELSYHPDSAGMENLRRALDAGRLNRVVIHEYAHNFELFYTHWRYVEDHGHAWTEFTEYFMRDAFGRQGTSTERPEELYPGIADASWQVLLAAPGNGWASCVRDATCADDGSRYGTPRSAWSALYHRVYQLYGPDAITDSFLWLDGEIAATAPPTTAEGREDLRARSLAEGAQSNIACLLRELRYPVDAASEADWTGRFGATNPFCVDADGDQLNAVLGDCDDSRANVNPGANERAGNGRDDNCNRLVDEAEWDEGVDGDLRAPFEAGLDFLDLPVVVDGVITDANDEDTFEFPLPDSERIRLTMCAGEGFAGFAVPLDQNNDFLDLEGFSTFASAGGCRTEAYDLSGLPVGRMWLTDNDSPGPYQLSLQGGEPWPVDASPGIEVAPRLATGVGMRIDVRDTGGVLSAAGVDEIQAWVSGQGIVGSRPVTPVARLQAGHGPQKRAAFETSFVVTPGTAPALTDGALYQARILALRDGVALEHWSGGHLFRYEQSPGALPAASHVYSGSWFDPSHDGEGFIVEVLAGGIAVVYWFTYQADGDQRWFLGVGTLKGNRIVIDELLSTRGGRFGPDFDPDEVITLVPGSLSLTFLDCGSALANFSVNGVGAHLVLSRITTLPGHECLSPPVSIGTQDLSGSWYDPSHDGEGFIVEMLTTDSALVYWFTYNDQGDQAWLVGIGSVAGGTITIDEMRRVQGPRFGRSFDPDDRVQTVWGSLELELDCAGGEASYVTSAEGFSSGSQQLVSLVRLDQSGCL